MQRPIEYYQNLVDAIPVEELVFTWNHLPLTISGETLTPIESAFSRSTILKDITKADEIIQTFEDWNLLGEDSFREKVNIVLNAATNENVFGILVAVTGAGITIVPVAKTDEVFDAISDFSVWEKPGLMRINGWPIMRSVLTKALRSNEDFLRNRILPVLTLPDPPGYRSHDE